MKKGKIICVVGAPRTGKSFLVKKLAKHYKTKAFYEGEDADFPNRIKQDIAKNIRPLERILWFRNRLANNYRDALAIKNRGGIAISDITYFALNFYIDILTRDPFEREILRALLRLDEKIFGLPDKIIHLVSNEQKIKEFIKIGGREFDAGENYFNEQVLPLQNAIRKYLRQLKKTGIVVEINRAKLDFENKTDFKKIIRQIER
jgi:deoxyadenosine/deoxycytidine kinase